MPREQVLSFGNNKSRFSFFNTDENANTYIMGSTPEISLRILEKGFSIVENESYISGPDFLIFDKSRFEYCQLTGLKNIEFDL